MLCEMTIYPQYSVGLQFFWSIFDIILVFFFLPLHYHINTLNLPSPDYENFGESNHWNGFMTMIFPVSLSQYIRYQPNDQALIEYSR